MADQVSSWTNNRLTSRLGLQYPIIQGPLGGLSSQRLTAAVSNYGGLGSFGAHSLKPQAIRHVPSGAEAHGFWMSIMYGLKPVPFTQRLTEARTLHSRAD
jgi:Nitronate monooxygenase